MNRMPDHHGEPRPDPAMRELIDAITTIPATDLAALGVQYVAGGLSIIPIGDDKRPFGPALPRDPETGKATWKPFQSRLATTEQVEQWARMRGVHGFAVVCGAISGGLLILDFDEPGFYEQWAALVGDDLDELPVQRTGGGGHQVAVRCDQPGRNDQLAWMPDTDEPNGRRIAIETRAEGGYAVLPGALHPSGKRYESIAGEWGAIPWRSQESVAFMLDCARRLDRAPLTTQQLLQKAKAAKPINRASLNGQAGVIDRWNEAHPLPGVLRNFGYTPFGDRFTRPGADASPGGVVILDGRSFHHSSNDPLHDEHTHDAFSVFTHYAHHGDPKAAVRAAAADLGIAHGSHTDHAASGPPAVPQFQSAAKLIADHPHLRPPVIHGLLRVGEVGNLVSAPKSHKTYSAMALSLAVATGQRWLNFQTEQGNVLYLDAELHPPTFANRLPKVAAAMGLMSDQWHDRLMVDTMRGRLVNVYNLGPYIRAIEPGRFRLIVIDSLYRFWPPDTNENDNGCITAVYNALDDYAQHLGAAIVIVHHASKGLQSEKAVTDVGSGAGAQSRAADAHMVLRPHEAEGAVVFDAAVRSWPPCNPFCIRWTYPIWTLADDLDPADLRKAPSRRKPKPEGADEPKAEPWTLERFARSFITPEPQDQKTVLAEARVAGLSGRAASDFVALAVKRGLAHRWAFTGKTVYLADRTQPVTAAEPGQNDVCTHARAPHTPHATTSVAGGEVDGANESTPSEANR